MPAIKSAKHNSLINKKKTCKICGEYGTYQKTRLCYPHFKEYQKSSMGYRNRLNKNMMTKEHFQEQWEAQGHKCAICGTTDNTDLQDWSSDHNHITGKLRGVLCIKCNTNVGIIENKGMDYTLSIIDYLKYWL